MEQETKRAAPGSRTRGCSDLRRPPSGACRLNRRRPKAGRVPLIALPRQPLALRRGRRRFDGSRQPAAGTSSPGRGAEPASASPRPTQDSAAQSEMFFSALFAVSLAFPQRTGPALRTIAFEALALLPSRLPHRASSSPILTSSTQKTVWMIFLGASLGEIDGRTGGLAHPSGRSRPSSPVSSASWRVRRSGSKRAPWTASSSR